MNAITPASDFSRPANYAVGNTAWGYIIRCMGRNRIMTVVLQWLAATVGGALLLGAAGFWVLPGSLIAAELIGIKAAISGVFALVGGAMIWFAAHGTHYELQVDLARRELREVLRTGRGRTKLLGRVLFEDIDSVYIDRIRVKKGNVRLLLRTGNLRQVIEVALDREENLAALCDRMGCDILGLGAKKARPNSKRGFLFPEARGVVQPEMMAA